MPPIVSSIDIARPPDEVFAYATDPSRFAARPGRRRRSATRI